MDHRHPPPLLDWKWASGWIAKINGAIGSGQRLLLSTTAPVKFALLLTITATDMSSGSAPPRFASLRTDSLPGWPCGIEDAVTVLSPATILERVGSGSSSSHWRHFHS